MAEETPYVRLVTLLRELGVRTLDDRMVDGQVGFPLSVPLRDGGSLVLDLPHPGLVATLDPEMIGVAILDPLGYPRTTWGLARRVPFFRTTASVLESPMGGLLETASLGEPGALYLDGFRYFSSPLGGDAAGDVFVLIVNAGDERQARRQATKSGRMASALKRLGKALTMNQTTQAMAISAAHEIASVVELASVLIWTHDAEQGTLELAASVGANRLGTSVLNRLSNKDASGCVAELVAATRHPFTVSNVLDHLLTANLEAKFCYLKPGGVSVHPLEISGRLIGVLEMVSREGEPHFAENGELFETVAEHLALALNSAAMFENFERLASHDALTGTANHRYMQEYLHQRVFEAQRTGQTVGAIMIDVDHFRSFNEEEGHDAGDAVLRLVSDALRASLRPFDPLTRYGDLAARYGGEEFTVIMPGATAESVMAVAERIRAKVESIPFVTKSGRERNVTVSAGCALYPDSANDSQSLLKAADIALFDAKRAGRNRVSFASGLPPEPPPHGPIDLESLCAWLPAPERELATARVARLEPDMVSLATALKLSRSQCAILEGLLWVAPIYLERQEVDDQAWLTDFAARPEFRLMRPSLEALSQRFDGRGRSGSNGSQIPLLARILHVLLALDSGEPLFKDAGRFDPEILTALTEHHRAA